MPTDPIDLENVGPSEAIIAKFSQREQKSGELDAGLPKYNSGAELWAVVTDTDQYYYSGSYCDKIDC